MNFVDAALTHAQDRDVSSYLLALVSGAATSIGPCVAPRYVAITTLAGSANGARFLRLSAFIVGTVTVYFLIASAGSIVMRLTQASSLIYLLLAGALILSGFITLLRSGHSCADASRQGSSVGAAFLLGAGTSTVISPCCTPVLVALGALSAGTNGSLPVVGLVSAYAIGHLAPLVALFSVAGTAGWLMNVHRGPAITISSGVTIALGIYYAVLA